MNKEVIMHLFCTHWRSACRKGSDSCAAGLCALRFSLHSCRPSLGKSCNVSRCVRSGSVSACSPLREPGSAVHREREWRLPLALQRLACRETGLAGNVHTSAKLVLPCASPSMCRLCARLSLPESCHLVLECTMGLQLACMLCASLPACMLHGETAACLQGHWAQAPVLLLS